MDEGCGTKKRETQSVSKVHVMSQVPRGREEFSDLNNQGPCVLRFGVSRSECDSRYILLAPTQIHTHKHMVKHILPVVLVKFFVMMVKLRNCYATLSTFGSMAWALVKRTNDGYLKSYVLTITTEWRPIVTVINRNGQTVVASVEMPVTKEAEAEAAPTAAATAAIVSVKFKAMTAL